MKGWFEISGEWPFVLREISWHYEKYAGTVYAVEFGDGTVKVGKTRRPRERMKGFETTAQSYGKSQITRIGVSPFHCNYDLVETLLHTLLWKFWIERELYEGTVESVAEKISIINLDVIISCKFKRSRDYFNSKNGTDLYALYGWEGHPDEL